MLDILKFTGQCLGSFYAKQEVEKIKGIDL